MPELPEVETVRAGLEHGIINKTIARVVLHRADLRLPFPAGFAQHLEGSTITSVRRRAKYLLIHLSGGVVWLAHLGMSGRFSLLRAAPDMFKRHEHVAVIFTDGAALIYNDPRRFGVMDVVAADAISTHKLLAHLGFEPLAKDFPTAAFAAKLKARGTSIKQALMDASLVVGVGNIYASE
ncbi:MAG: DNA-formamidopyrimidine glycosylase, partial [Alphaproteobacteria bacterium]|nr:DNA-formamidopyrimidine glycosylase [Alphaproteobacteria bacterium]